MKKLKDNVPLRIMKNNEWFASWFDTKYYHLIYKNRNDAEAQVFIENLIKHLNLQKGSKVLDLACGKGRHSITLNKMGFEVNGVDLSANSIAAAKNHENESLRFFVRDMRDSNGENCFDAVFNLFTSFGYFDSTHDNEKVIESVHNSLKQNGILVLDFMNTQRIIDTLVASETKEISGIQFDISRHYDGNHIFKTITFEDDGKEYEYTERVQALFLDNFTHILKSNGFNILSTFGNFELDTFDAKTSDRLILIAQKH
jgi:2-polyprenyl-3-methyl-5-hydroxy-6-metoxy-1,4-benzoquinol methylase